MLQLNASLPLILFLLINQIHIFNVKIMNNYQNKIIPVARANTWIFTVIEIN